jgi:hypothetical protein
LLFGRNVTVPMVRSFSTRPSQASQRNSERPALSMFDRIMDKEGETADTRAGGPGLGAALAARWRDREHARWRRGSRPQHFFGPTVRRPRRSRCGSRSSELGPQAELLAELGDRVHAVELDLYWLRRFAYVSVAET